MESRAACNLYETTATGCRPAGAARDASRFTLSVRALAELNYPSRSRDGMRRDTAGLGGERWDIRLLSLSLSLERARRERARKQRSIRSGYLRYAPMAIRCDKRTREVYAPWRMRDFFPPSWRIYSKRDREINSPGASGGGESGPPSAPRGERDEMEASVEIQSSPQPLIARSPGLLSLSSSVSNL